ncbi:TIGR04255 family protein [Paracoccus sp. YIM 132242]|uniref:TIGR04255 family protein n=1 Tax=Paracoccus lichenicola TaxID=2665644 RepID=A0A6L6HTR4_9RHOB|nr:TIGR04255 family protein [Paracoccus lichenicola]MTE01680.1 TIGR04255 family protein [Paracoccus lichenicola]
MATLPDFQDPPVDEVVLGIQFESPAAYTSIFAGQIWELYRAEFPKVMEVPRLEPQFEIFGGNAAPGINFNFGPPPLRGRLWFLSEDESHLVQIQEDRLFLNWRKRPNGITEQPYPRYEQIAGSFRQSVKLLDDFFLKTFGKGLQITQAEAAYINSVLEKAFSDVGKTFSFLQAGRLNLEGYATNLVEILQDVAGKPVARAFYELQSFNGQDGSKLARFNLTVRGKPAGTTIEDSFRFIDFARENIVSKFCELTTPEAHAIWGRKK